MRGIDQKKLKLSASKSISSLDDISLIRNNKKASYTTQKDIAMDDCIPDGEYNIDFSGLFRSQKGDFFGVKYSFKPDTIDEHQPSQLYIDDENWYLVSEAKASEKSVSTNFNQDKVYFEGKCAQCNTLSSVQNQATSGLNIIDNGSVSQINEVLLSFDPISKSFELNPFDGCVKLNKSREPRLIYNRISKIKKPMGNFKHTLFLDSFLEKFNNQQMRTIKSPIKLVDHIRANRKEAKPSYNQILSKLSPVRRNAPTFPSIASPNLNSPTFSIPSPTISIPSPTRSPHSSSSNSSKLTTSSSTYDKTTTNSNSPTSSSTKPLSSNTSLRSKTAIPNGGTGTKKTQKSLLLRKAERAIGLNTTTNPKLKKSEHAPAPYIRKPVSKNPIVTKKKEIKNTHIVLEREMKEAKPDQTTFELVLLPPEPKSVEINVTQPAKTNTDNAAKNIATKTISKPEVEPNVENKDSTSYGMIDLPTQEVKDFSDDFEMDFSDWDDNDVIGTTAFSPDGLGSGFNLIIEDDPFKSKRELKEITKTYSTKETAQKQEKETTINMEESSTQSNALNADVKSSTTANKSEEMKLSNSSNSAVNEQELEAELDRVFDDIQFDDEMSEEE